MQEFVTAQIRPQLPVPFPHQVTYVDRTGKPGVKVGPEASSRRPARSLGSSLSLSPSLIGSSSQGFSCSFLAIGWGLAFSPLSLFLPSPSLSLTPRTGAHCLPPVPWEGRNLGEEKKNKNFPISLDQRKDGKTERGRGRGRREREREEKERERIKKKKK